MWQRRKRAVRDGQLPKIMVSLGYPVYCIILPSSNGGIARNVCLFFPEPPPLQKLSSNQADQKPYKPPF